MQEYTVRQTGKRPLAFVGEYLAGIRTSLNETGASESIMVFKTKGGSYIFGHRLEGDLKGKRDVYSAKVFNTLDDMLLYLEDIEIRPKVIDEIIEQLSEVESIAEAIE